MKQLDFKHGKLNCITAYPDNFNPDKTYPAIFCLHGAGYRGNNIEILRENPFFLKAAEIKDFGFILIAPQCSEDTWFDLFDELKSLVYDIRELPFIDEHCFYMMGASMGGYASWQLAMSIPECFAAVAPVCGGGMYWNAERLKDVGVWAFHGGRDDCVMPEESKKMVNAVNACGGKAKLTVYPENGHNAWDDTYSDPELYKWFLSHTK